MKRTMSLVVALGMGVGWMSAGAATRPGRVQDREVPARERARVLVTVRRALALLPKPRGYDLDDESVTSEAEPTAAWNGAGWTAPVVARAERAFEPPDPDRADAPPALEQRVFANSEVGLPSGLASETGVLRVFPMAEGAAVEATLAGMDDAPQGGGRVALPVGPGQAASALTIIRVLVADPPSERAFRAAARSGALRLRPRTPPARAGAVQTLVIELYGGRRDVEAAARRVPVASLRRLLDR